MFAGPAETMDTERTLISGLVLGTSLPSKFF